MHGQKGGETGVDNQVAEAAFEGIGAWIHGSALQEAGLAMELER
jgi:hypothetical protein